MLKMRLKFFRINKFMILGILLLGFLIRFIIGYYSESVISHAEIEALNYAEQIIMDSITNNVIVNLDNTKLFISEYKDNKLVRMYLDTQKLNKIRNEVALYTDTIVEEINHSKDLNDVNVPLGYFFGLKKLLDLEVNIPISMEIIGNQNVEITYEAISKGINTTIIEFFINISVDMKLALPLKIIELTSETSIPLAYEIINNDVPYFYSNR